MRKIVSLLLSAGIVLGGVSAITPSKEVFAEESAENPLSYENNGYEISITSCDLRYRGELVIPSEIDGKPVTEIKEGAFLNRFGITSLTLPDSLVYVRQNAFFGMTGLTELTIPKNVITLGNHALGCEENSKITVKFASADTNFSSNCFALVSGEKEEKRTAMTLEGTADSYAIKYAKGTGLKYNIIEEEKSDDKEVKEDGLTYRINSEYAILTSCDKDKAGKVIIPPEIEGVPVRRIADTAFRGVGITEVSIPYSVQQIGQAAFAATFLKEIILPNSVKEISKEAFISTNLTKVVILNDRCSIADTDSTIANNYPLEKGRYIYNGVIISTKNSSASKYAQKFGYEFIELGNEDIIIYGDANESGDIDLADAVAIMQSIANPDKYPLDAKAVKAADVSGNGDGITNRDALAIQKYMLKLIDKLPE